MDPFCPIHVRGVRALITGISRKNIAGALNAPSVNHSTVGGPTGLHTVQDAAGWAKYADCNPTTSQLHHFTISPLHHSTASPLHHLTTSVFLSYENHPMVFADRDDYVPVVGVRSLVLA